MDKLFQRFIDPDLPPLSGLAVDANISVTEALANEFIAITLQDNPQIEYCRVHIHGENRVTLDVKSPLWPWPFNVKLRLFSSVDITPSPIVRAFLENHVLLGKLGLLLKALPEGINMYEDQVSIHIESFMPLQEQRMLLTLIQSIEIRTEEGRIFFDIKANR